MDGKDGEDGTDGKDRKDGKDGAEGKADGRDGKHPPHRSYPSYQPSPSDPPNCPTGPLLALPKYALHRWHRSDALEEEPLHAFPFIRFGRVHVALGVGGDAVDAEELTRLTTAVAELRQERSEERRVGKECRL